jgi:cytochrome oxidase Cu insertion factor (SCO1/SenC/PrrC family)
MMRLRRFSAVSMGLLGLLLLLNVKAEPVGGDFSLIDHHGSIFELKQLRGKAVLLFFGYTYCPDICPTELAGIATLLNSLEGSKEKVQALFVSVDPERDTPEKLKEYVSFFSPELIGLTGTLEQIDSVKEQYHVQANIYRADKNSERYSVDHTANLYVIDQQGKLASIVPYGFPINHVQSILSALID